jgi:hypothetical protein
VLTPEQRVPFYRELWDIWNTGEHWVQHADGTWHESDPPVAWPVLEQAILREATP